MLSAMQLAKGERKNEVPFLVTLKMNEAMGKGQIPSKVLDILKSFVDVMLSKLPKKLLLK